MLFTENHLYHVYNRGNQQQPIFYERNNYLLFLDNIQKFISPHTDILAWCLMPNHFHLLLHANERSTAIIRAHPIKINALTEAIRLTLTSYTKTLQQQRGFTGSLFQQKTKLKCVEDGSRHYGLTAFNYIHQNPMKARLCSKMEDWEFSSFRAYIGADKNSICNQELALELLDLNLKTIYKDSYEMIASENLHYILKP